MATNLHWLEVLGRCRSWLEGMRGKVPSTPDVVLEAGHSGVLMQWSLCYACDTLDAIVTELLAGRPLQAGVLVRTVFELAVRIRWASLHEDGWRRLSAYWFHLHKKSLDKADRGYLDAEATDRVDKTLAAYGAFLDGVTRSRPVQFDQVLDQVVEKLDGCENPQWSGGLYNGYRDLCRYAHANITVCGGGIPISEIGRVLLSGVAYATVQFVEAARATFDFAISEEQLDGLYGLPGLGNTCSWEPEVPEA